MTTGAADTGTDARDTFPKLLAERARTGPDRPAYREKEYGIWQTYDWAHVARQVAPAGGGPGRSRLRRGDRLIVIGDNRPRLYWSMCAAQSLGGVPVPVYQDSVTDELAYVVEHAGARFALAENQEQVDKLLEIQKKVPSLGVVIYDDPRGLRHYEGLLSYAAVQERGAQLLAATPDLVSAEVAQGRGSDDAIMLYTSGTTGRPKGAVLSYDNLVWAARAGAEFDGLREGDELLSYLPMAWVGDHIFSYAQGYVVGLVVNCPESAATVMTDLREIGPTYYFAPPRVLENLITQVTIRMEDAGFLKRRMFQSFMTLARRVGPALLDGRPVAALDRLLYALGNLLVYGPLKNTLGMSRVRVAYTAGEAVGPEIFNFYRALGVNMKQLYGQTEASVFVTIHPNGEVFSDTVGKPVSEVELRIAEFGRGALPQPRRVQGVFQESRGHQRHQDRRRLGAYRRCGLPRRARAPAHHRSRPRRRQTERRHAVRAQVHREQAEVLPAHQRGGGVRPRPRLRRGLRQHRHDGGRRLGRAAQHRLCELPGAGGRARKSTTSCRARSSGSTATSPPIRAWRAPRSAAS